MHVLVIEGDPNIVVVNIAVFDISLLLVRTSIEQRLETLRLLLYTHST